MTYLGIDYGRKRIGLAIATDETPPVPYRTLVISNQQSATSDIVDIIQRERVDIVVVGSPRSMREGEKTAIEKEVEQFVANLKSEILNLKLSAPVYLEDERLTSKLADALKREFGVSGQRDAVAAMLILEAYLSKFSDANKSSK